jgi:hypothetical protein
MAKKTWNVMSTAPKDGTEKLLLIPSVEARAFWCKEQNRWVLSSPMNREYADDALAWMNTGSD